MNDKRLPCLARYNLPISKQIPSSPLGLRHSSTRPTTTTTTAATTSTNGLVSSRATKWTIGHTPLSNSLVRQRTMVATQCELVRASKGQVSTLGDDDQPVVLRQEEEEEEESDAYKRAIQDLNLLQGNSQVIAPTKAISPLFTLSNSTSGSLSFSTNRQLDLWRRTVLLRNFCPSR